MSVRPIRHDAQDGSPTVPGAPPVRRIRPLARPRLVLALLAGVACGPPDGTAASAVGGGRTAAQDAWIPLFDGATLEGWTPKIAGAEAGEDPWGTFRVEDGLLTVGYEGYDDFGRRFGHLFYATPYSHYRLQVEYRFVGEQAPGGQAWAFKNSGVMFHSQSPGSMLRDQDFPISLEAQFLGGNGTDPRPTANLCTPGTHVEMDGVLVEQHCIDSSSPTFHGEEWVRVELEVHGGDRILHLVNGDTVIAYERPVIGGGVVNGHDPAAKPDGQPLTGGYIALQSESHPIQFRTVRLLPLESDARESANERD